MTTVQRVLVVDDTPDVRMLLRIALETAATYEVVDEAKDGREAVALAALHQPDIVVIDQMMPGLSGIETVPLLREVAPNAAMVLYSAVSPAIIAEQSPDVDATVQKGDVDELIRVLDEVTARRAESPSS